MTEQDLKTDTLSAAVVNIRQRELPLYCPRDEDKGASLHPRVFIPLSRVGDEATCRYCRTHYRLVE